MFLHKICRTERQEKIVAQKYPVTSYFWTGLQHVGHLLASQSHAGEEYLTQEYYNLCTPRWPIIGQVS